MDSALIVSSTEKGAAYFSDMLTVASCHSIAVLRSGGEARRTLLERSFDLVIVDAPLQDESGESLSRYISGSGIAQVILVVKSEFFDAVSAVTEDDGVLTIAKPIHRAVFWSALKLARSAQNSLRRVRDENSRLKQKLEDIRIVNRAKCLLISCLNMDEQEAHRHIEKQAMDLRQTKRAVAEDILKTYES